MTNGSLMKVESIAECSPWRILQYFWPTLTDNWYWKPIFGLFENGRLRQVLLYISNNMDLCLQTYYIFQRELSIINFTLNYPPIRNNLTSASLLSMLIETDYLNYPPIRNNLTSTSLPSMIIETDYNLVAYESHDRAALPSLDMPRQKYIFPFPKH